MKRSINLLAFVLASCILEDPKEGINADDVIEWKNESQLSVLANGIDKAEISIILKDTDPNLNVTFKADQGFFSGEKATEKPREVTVKTSGKEASVSLNSDLRANDQVVVRASVGGFSIEQTVRFLPSYPAEMIVITEYDTLVANQANSLRIFFAVFRPEGQGKVSDGLRIVLSQTKETGDAVLILPPFIEALNEQATLTVRSATKGKGKVRLKASIPGSDGAPIERTVDITLK